MEDRSLDFAVLCESSPRCSVKRERSWGPIGGRAEHAEHSERKYLCERPKLTVPRGSCSASSQSTEDGSDRSPAARRRVGRASAHSIPQPSRASASPYLTECTAAKGKLSVAFPSWLIVTNVSAVFLAAPSSVSHGIDARTSELAPPPVLMPMSCKKQLRR